MQDGMLDHCMVIPSIKFVGTHSMHLGGERHSESKVSCQAIYSVYNNVSAFNKHWFILKLGLGKFLNFAWEELNVISVNPNIELESNLELPTQSICLTQMDTMCWSI